MHPNKSTKRPRGQTEQGTLNLDQATPTEHGGLNLKEASSFKSKEKPLKNDAIAYKGILFIY